ncbi:MAG: YwaF family protein [Oscillospiraceae bacterium]|nr:YwaF family protein [Oscillospiraceae bacterium]
MKYFWYTSDTIPKGLGWSHFDPLHLAWLLGGVAVIALCCLLYRRLNEKQRGSFRKTIALLLIADELWKVVPMVAMGVFRVAYLPFELCSINLFLIAWHAWRPGKTLSTFLYTVCIPGALAAMLFPTWTKLPAWNFMLIHSFTVHILLILYPVVLTAGGDIKPRLRDVPKCMALLLVLAGIALMLNLSWDTNFMFLMDVGKSNPLYIFEKAWGNHLLGFPVLISAIVIVMYVPIELYHKLKR